MKNKRELAKNIIKGMALVGSIIIVSTSPTFIHKILPRLARYAFYKIKNKKDRKKFYDTFYRLNSEGLIRTVKKGKQIYISLTPEGRKKAGKYQIDDLIIKKPKKWDGKWRIIIFDIKNKQRFKREALRGKIKELGLYQIQKSVWVHPYDIRREFDTLRVFFSLTPSEMNIVTAVELGDDKKARKFFKLV